MSQLLNRMITNKHTSRQKPAGKDLTDYVYRDRKMDEMSRSVAEAPNIHLWPTRGANSLANDHRRRRLVVVKQPAACIQRPRYQREVRAKIQQAIGQHEDFPDHRKETQTAVAWTRLPFIRSGQNHLARHGERGKEDKADKGRGGKTTSGNGQAWSLASPRGQWRIGKNGENWLRNHLWCPKDPRG